MTAVIHVITQAADFTRVLNTPCQSRSTHFAVHHLARAPGRKPFKGAPLVRPTPSLDRAELSTAAVNSPPSPVDESAPSGFWLGLVVPKRHAKRAVTRTLLKRRIRAALTDACELAPGMWVVRLRAPFSRTDFVSAASDRLSTAVSAELATLMTAASARAPR